MMCAGWPCVLDKFIVKRDTNHVIGQVAESFDAYTENDLDYMGGCITGIQELLDLNVDYDNC